MNANCARLTSRVMWQNILVILLLSWGGLYSGLYGQAGKIKIVQVGSLDLQKVFQEIREDSLLRYVLEQGASQDLVEARELDKKLTELKNLLIKEQDGGNLEKIEALQSEIAYLQSELRYLLADSASISIEKNDTDSTFSRTVFNEIYRIIRQVAQREGYSLILEKGTSVIYVEPELDITLLVMDELNKIKASQ